MTAECINVASHLPALAERQPDTLAVRVGMWPGAIGS